MLHWWHAVVLGLVEGITEYLPVSSTGHLIIASQVMGLKGPNVKEALDSFEIIIQGGAILAVVGLYWPRFIQMLRGLLGQDNAGFALAFNIFMGFLPSAVLGLLLKRKIDAFLFFAGPVVLAMIVGGVYMILVEHWRDGRIARPRPTSAEQGIDTITPRQALFIGFLQCFSLWPGTSRSMMTITGGYFCKLKPKAAAEFSFLLGVPTLLGATCKALFDDYRDHLANHTPLFYQTLGPVPVIIGLVVAALSAAVAVRWLVGFLNRRGLVPFGIYRIIFGVALTGLILGQVITITPDTPATKPPAPPTTTSYPQQPAVLDFSMQPTKSDPLILGGVPCFTGTRVPVSSLFDHLKKGYTVDYFLNQFPTVKREQAIAVLDAAYKQPPSDDQRRAAG